MSSQVEHAPMVASAFAEKVKDKIQAAVIELIPDEQWKTLIETEIKHFMEPDRSRRDPISPLASMIREEVQKLLQAQLKELLEGELRTVWEANRNDMPDIVKEAVKENAHELMAAMVSDTMAQCLQAMQTRLQDALRGY